MLPAPNVIFHDIEKQESIARNVTDILGQLSHPLPKLLTADDVRERLSPGALEMYDEVLRSPSLVLEESSIQSHIGRPVTDILDTVLSCVRMVKAASSFSPTRLFQQSKSSWVSLISVLGIAISEDVFILYGLSYPKV